MGAASAHLSLKPVQTKWSLCFSLPLLLLKTVCSVFFPLISIRLSYFRDVTLCSVALGSSCHAGQPHNCLKKTQKREGHGYRIQRHHFTFWWFLTTMAAEVVLPAVRPCNESQPGIDPAKGKKKRCIFQPNGLSYCVLGQGKLRDWVLRLRGA